jgi:protein-disulfide isomerase
MAQRAWSHTRQVQCSHELREVATSHVTGSDFAPLHGVEFLQGGPALHAQLIHRLTPDDHVRGEGDAAITLVMYGDYESSWCGLLHSLVTIVQRVMRGGVRVAYRHFPRENAHPHAQHAAEIAEAAGYRGRFWAMHDLLFAHQDALDDQALINYASAVGLDPGWAMAVLRVHTFAERVRRDFLSGVESGVSNAPTLFINDFRYEDAQTAPSLIVALQNARYIARRR